MQGFFTKKETGSVNRTGGKAHSCAACGLYRGCQTPKMKPFGNFAKGIMVIGDAPEDVDDMKGRPWQGKAGRLLRRTYERMGIDLFEDCLSMNAVNCRPSDRTGSNRSPSPDEINHCRSVLVLKAIKEYQPKVIVLLGGTAIQSIIGHRWQGSSGEVNKWRGFAIPDQDFKAWICPTFHPSYLERSGQKKELMTIWKQDLNQSIQKTTEPFPKYKEPDIEYVDDLKFLDLGTSNLCAFDYETTGLKPHAKGHRIKTAAIADSPDHCWVFRMPKTRKGRAPLRRWLRDPGIAKMAHNIKYEETWSRVILKERVRGWEWDSMLAAHLLDNRPGITGLKFQAYVNFGIVDYASEIDSCLKSPPKEGGNAFNTLDKFIRDPVGLEKVLRYNALDSILEYRLALKQMEILNHDYLPF